MTTADCWIKVCITDHIQTTFYRKNRPNTDQCLWKYRPLFENVIAKSPKLKIGALCQIRLLSLYLASSQWILTQSTQWRVHTLKSIWMMASLKLVEASPKILTFWINTDQLQTIFNHFSEKVCITDQNYLYRPNCHHWGWSKKKREKIWENWPGWFIVMFRISNKNWKNKKLFQPPSGLFDMN